MYTVYLAGEIHSNWREEIINGCKDCDINFLHLRMSMRVVMT